MKRFISTFSLLYLLAPAMGLSQEGNSANTPSEYLDSPFGRPSETGAGNQFRTGNLFDSETAERQAPYPSAKRSLNPATYLNPDTGVPAYLNYAGTVNTYVGSLGSAAGLAAAVGANLSGAGFAGAGQAVAISQQQAANTTLASSNLLQQFALSPSGGALRFQAYSNTLNRTSTGDLSNPASRPPMDAMIAANRTGGYNVLPGQAAALASVPSGINSALQAYKLSDNPSHLAHSPYVAAREFIGNGNKFFGLEENSRFDAGTAVNAWFRERLSDFLFNENHEDQKPDGTTPEALAVAVLSGSDGEIWGTKKGWWAMFGDVLYGVGDDIEISGGSVSALANRASQKGTMKDIAPVPGPVAIMDGIVLDSVRAIATVLNARCTQINDTSNDDILDPGRYGLSTAGAEMGLIERDPGVFAALNYLSTKEHQFKVSDADILWRQLSTSVGSGSGACAYMSQLVGSPESLVGKMRAANSVPIFPWERTLYFYAEQLTNLKFDQSVKKAVEMINSRIVSNMIPAEYGSEALRLIDQSRRYYYESRERFRQSLQGLQAQFAVESSTGGAVGGAYQRDNDGAGVGAFGAGGM